MYIQFLTQTDAIPHKRNGHYASHKTLVEYKESIQYFGTLLTMTSEQKLKVKEVLTQALQEFQQRYKVSGDPDIYCYFLDYDSNLSDNVGGYCPYARCIYLYFSGTFFDQVDPYIHLRTTFLHELCHFYFALTLAMNTLSQYLVTEGINDTIALSFPDTKLVTYQTLPIAQTDRLKQQEIWDKRDDLYPQTYFKYFFWNERYVGYRVGYTLLGMLQPDVTDTANLEQVFSDAMDLYYEREGIILQ